MKISFVSFLVVVVGFLWGFLFKVANTKNTFNKTNLKQITMPDYLNNYQKLLQLAYAGTTLKNPRTWM